ncbi:MAG TPA: tetratricopeptide repeat protein [Acidobacteriota bacterium]|nr:tetratricopeptide repeat protein [Acidobacteriota bacterium]
MKEMEIHPKSRSSGGWVLLLPLLLLVASAWLYRESESEVRVQFSRAREDWRAERYEAAISLLENLRREYPNSRLADDALWEIATIYYVNLYDIDRALASFEELVSQYPSSPVATEARLKLAEIYELELNELPEAVAQWTAALARGHLSDAEEAQVRFRVGDAYFRLNQFDDSLEVLQSLLKDTSDEYLRQQIRLRIGTIHQIRKEYEKSIDMFLAVLESNACKDCRTRARLSLIESYEYLDRLPEAIEVARTMDTSEYPTGMKDNLLQRLLEKQRYYEPRLWNGR